MHARGFRSHCAAVLFLSCAVAIVLRCWRNILRTTALPTTEKEYVADVVRMRATTNRNPAESIRRGLCVSVPVLIFVADCLRTRDDAPRRAADVNPTDGIGAAVGCNQTDLWAVCGPIVDNGTVCTNRTRTECDSVAICCKYVAVC
jgi:hypothetical protein